MERVATPRGIDGGMRIGHGPAIGRLLRALAAAAALSVAGTLEAQESPSAKNDGQGAKTVRPAEVEFDETLIAKLVKQLDDDEFASRQEASRLLLQRLQSAFDMGETEAAALFAQIEKDPKKQPRALSREQRYRLDHLRDRLASLHLEPSALGELGAIRGDAALHELRKKTGVPIDTDDETLRALAAVEIDASGERATRMSTDVLASLCRATKTMPMPLPNGEIRLVPVQAGESVASSKDLIGIVRADENGVPYSMSLQMEPGRGVILAFVDAEGRFAPNIPDAYKLDRDIAKPGKPFAVPIDLDIAASGRVNWKGSFDQKIVHRTKKAVDGNALRAVIANGPISERLAIDGKPKNIGIQSIAATTVEETPTDEWKLTIVSNVCGEVPWAPTPGAWDSLTYGVAHANRYAARDDAGEEMHPVIESTECNMRVMTVKIVYPRKPRDVTVHGFSGMDLRMLDLPIPVTPPAPVPPSDPAAK